MTTKTNNVIDLRARSDLRRNPDGSRQAYVKELQAWHQNVLLMKITGLTNKEIAERLSCSSGHVSTIVNSPAFKAAQEQFFLARVADTLDLQKELLCLVPSAVDAIRDTFVSDDAKANDKLRAAFGVLDRVGAPPKVRFNADGSAQGVEQRHVHIHLTQEEAEILRERARKARVPEFVEAETSEEDDA